MKTQCDSCRKKMATVFCYTEERALCSPCDHDAHQQDNTDHQRFSFSYPVQKQIPMCDDCQETKAFIFCLEHRAIMCGNCDNSQHSDDKLATKHNRYIITGAKLCTDDDKNVADTNLNKDSTDEKHDDNIVNQPENESGVSSSSSHVSQETEPGAPGRAHLDMSSDDPYGLCKKKGTGAGATFDDTDLGCYLKSLSPKQS